jgi:hypothetical protein
MSNNTVALFFLNFLYTTLADKNVYNLINDEILLVFFLSYLHIDDEILTNITFNQVKLDSQLLNNIVEVVLCGQKIQTHIKKKNNIKEERIKMCSFKIIL